MTTVAIVVTYNRKELLQECIDALLAQSKPVEKILVINNASTDGTEKLFEAGAKYDLEQISLCNTAGKESEHGRKLPSYIVTFTIILHFVSLCKSGGGIFR